MSRQTRFFGAVLLVCIAAAAATALPARAATICVGGGGCAATLQAALAAASDGDTIRIGAGTFAGGVAVTKSVQIVGAGASRTAISDAAPVLTIGVEFANTEPTVSVSGVTITGGKNTSVPDRAVTHGGGVLIPQAGAFPFHTGATVTISDSSISGNTVGSSQFLPAGFCGPIDCSFASGGGIFNEGNLTLVNTRVTGNQAGPGTATVFANGGGIASSHRGLLTIERSSISSNTAIASADSGLGADGGGLTAGGPWSVSDSVVTGNSAVLVSASAGPDDHVAIAGGIHIQDNSTATITRTLVNGNRVTETSAAGGFAVVGVAAGLDVDGTLTITWSSIDRNVATAS